MVSYERKEVAENEKQQFLNIQGMDIIFILKNYSTEILNNYLESDLIKQLRRIENQIDNSTGANRELLLRKSYQFNTETYSQFKTFIDLLINQNFLYVIKNIIHTPVEGLDLDIQSLERDMADQINPQRVNPYSEHKLNSYKFVKFVKEQIAYCEYIFGILDSGLANKKKALQELNRIRTQLKTMGYEIKDPNKKVNATDGKRKIVLFMCDIMGTIDRAEGSDYIELAQKLQLLKAKNGADEIIFSLITGDENQNYLLHYVNKIVPFLEEYGIEIGKQFMQNSYYDNDIFTHYFKTSKIDKIIDYADELKSENELLSIYYVDDRPTYYNDGIGEALGETHYCCLGINTYESRNEDNYTGSTESNIKGVLQAIDFNVEPEKIEEIKKLVLQRNENNNEYTDTDDDDMPF